MQKWKYQYAALYLRKCGYKIFDKNSKKQLFLVDDNLSESYYSTSRVQTKVIEGKDFYKYKIDKRVIAYDELREMGFVITSFLVTKETAVRYGKRQAITSYRIVKPTALSIPVQRLPEDVIIEINPEENWVRLKGKNVYHNNHFGWGEKVYYQEKPIVEDKNYPEHPYEWAKLRSNPAWLYDTYNKIVRNKLYDENIENVNEIIISEIPIIFSDNKELVCIPAESSDVNRIGYYGVPGGGKTLSMTSLASRVVEKTNDMIININDPLDQYYNAALPAETTKFVTRLKWIGETPKPLPIINFWFAAKEVEEDIIDNVFNFILPFPYKILLDRWSEIFNNMEEFDLKNSAKYLTTFRSGLERCSTVEEVLTVLEAEMDDVKGWESMKFKWRGLFHTLFDTKCLDVNWGGEQIWQLYRNNKLVNEGHPLFISMEAGLFPNINTSRAKHHKWFKPLFAEWFRIIMRYQERKKQSERRRIWVFADELGDIHMQGKVRDCLSNSFLDLFRQGRPLDIYPVYNIQLISSLDPNVKKMTGVGVLTRLAHNDEKREIVKMFDIDKNELSGIDSMQPLHFIVVSKTPFVVYDRYGRKVDRNLCRRVYKGEFIPPLCHTHRPHKREEVDFNVEDRGVEA